MSFLTPFFLLGALAVAGPILFHLIRRTTREKTIFSSVMFLNPTAPRLTKRSRLENLLLLVLRCLALGLLALGFSRPFLRKSVAVGGSAAEARRIVILIDVSASMHRTGLWDAARQRASSILGDVEPGEEAEVFSFSRRTTPLVSFEEWRAAPAGDRKALAMARLSAQGPGWEEARTGDALIAAAEALADKDADKKQAGPRQIYLISDLKAGSRIDSLQAYEWPKNIELKVEAIKAPHPTNAGIQWVADASDADQLDSPAIRVRVSNAGNSTREAFQVGWAREKGGPYIAPPVDIYVPPGQSRVVAVPALKAAADMRQIVLRGDDEDFDNIVYVVPPEKLRWSVLYLGTEAEDDVRGPLYFLKRALPDNPHLAVNVVAQAPGRPLETQALEDAKLVIATASLPLDTVAALRSQMLAGKTVVFAPNGAQAADTLGALAGVAGLRLAEVHPSDYAMFGEIDFRHPLFAPFGDPHYSDFTKIHIWNFRRMKADAIPSGRVLARFDGGDPAVVEVPVGAGRLVLLLTGWNPDDSQLAVSSKFVPLIYSVLELAGGTSDGASQVFVGDPIPLGATASAAAGTVQKPDGSTVSLPAGTMRFDGAKEPGIYTLTTGTRVSRVAVNLAASESRTEPLPSDELERYGAPGPLRAPEAARAAERESLLQAAEAESRQKLWRWILGATLLLLFAESALAGWTTRKSRDTFDGRGMPT